MNNTFTFSNEEVNCLLKCIKTAFNLEPLSENNKKIATRLYDCINIQWHKQ